VSKGINKNHYGCNEIWKNNYTLSPNREALHYSGQQQYIKYIDIHLIVVKQIIEVRNKKAIPARIDFRSVESHCAKYVKYRSKHAVD
jgi:hypothetical protein